MSDNSIQEDLGSADRVQRGGLVLSRKKGQVVQIAEGLIVVTVAEIHGDSVRLHFSAPKNIRIMRPESALSVSIGEPLSELPV